LRVRAIDINGDWSFGNGAENYLVNINALQQMINTKLKFFLNDCFFAMTQGIDWFNLLGGKNQIALNLAINATILGTENVVSLNQLTLTLTSSRLITIVYSVNTTYGVIPTTSVAFVPEDYLITQSGQIITTQGGLPISI
jgi:hypothetical protein